MFMLYQTFQKPKAPRFPANTNPTLIYAVQPNGTGYPLNMDATQLVYSYADIKAVYDSAIANDNAMNQNYMMMQGMLAQEQARPNTQGTIYDRASPYNAHNKNISNLQNEMMKLKYLRSSSLDTAFLRLQLTYMSIQNPPTDGRPGLTQEQHEDAKRKMEHLLALKQAVQYSDTAYFNYPLQPTPYLTANLTAPQLITVPEPVKRTPPASNDGGNNEFISAPETVVNPVEPVAPVEGMVEPVLQ